MKVEPSKVGMARDRSWGHRSLGRDGGGGGDGVGRDIVLEPEAELEVVLLRARVNGLVGVEKHRAVVAAALAPHLMSGKMDQNKESYHRFG